MVNALLVTLISALVIALLNGAGTSYNLAPGGRSPILQILGLIPNPWEVAKTTVLLCPITAVSCGFFGLLAGLVGATLMSFRRGRVRSSRRYLMETAILGFLLAGLFPVLDGWMNGAQGFLCMLIGIPCALISALAFRKRFLNSV
jgi:hypothetical protein